MDSEAAAFLALLGADAEWLEAQPEPTSDCAQPASPAPDATIDHYASLLMLGACPMCGQTAR